MVKYKLPQNRKRVLQAKKKGVQYQVRWFFGLGIIRYYSGLIPKKSEAGHSRWDEFLQNG